VHRAIAELGFAAVGEARSCPVAAEDLPAPEVTCPELLVRFGEVSDGPVTILKLES
jgi:hypothetical protein